ncbi:hypothetical protein M3Y98_00687000 [Aphelenchoides besseyi]|nr:hypothetical protein M3Y98_00687000 [Aphelenchoides besseyi]
MVCCYVWFFFLPLATAQLRWDYDGNGPDRWNGSCQVGHRQSPVDIRSVDVDYALLPKLHYLNYVKVGPVRVLNNGHSGEFESKGCGNLFSVVVSGFEEWAENQPFIFGGALDGKYKLMQIHFHWASEDNRGSEHTIGTLHYPVEAHFVHKKEGINSTKLPPDGLAVIGVFLTLSTDASPMAGLEKSLSDVRNQNTAVSISSYSPLQLLPNNRDNFYTYDGSLTTPNCDEVVIWTVLAEPAPITREQLALLRALHSENGNLHKQTFRPTQPLNGRRIKYRSGSLDRIELCHRSASTRPTSLLGTLVLSVSSIFQLSFSVLSFIL